MSRNRMFWGIVIIVMGIIFLLQSIGLIQVNVWSLLGPFLIILLGGTLIYRTMFPNRSSLELKSLSLPVDGIEHVSVEIKHGAGKLKIQAGKEPDTLLKGDFHGGVEHTLSQNGTRANLSLRPHVDTVTMIPFTGPTEGYVWNVDFNPGLQYEFELKTGAGESQINFLDLPVSRIRLETGASSTYMTVPGKAGFTRVDVHAGAASVEIKIPEGVAARIRIQSGMASNSVDTARFPEADGYYCSPDYESSENKVEIFIDGGVGSFKIY